MSSKWIEVEGSQNLPLGEWLVTTKERRNRGNEVHVAKVYENVIYIGQYFDFDMPDVIAYMPAPAAYQDN